MTQQHVLSVDDDADLTWFLVEMPSTSIEDCRTSAACPAEEVVQKLRESPMDVVIPDLWVSGGIKGLWRHAASA